MPTKNHILNRQYVAKSRQKAIRNPHIQDRKLRSIDINEMLKVRQELKAERRKK